MDKFGDKFYEHFIIEKETEEYYKVRCKESGEEYKLYKCRISNNNYVCKNHVCRGCGKKIPLYNRDDYYLNTYNKMIEEYLNTTDYKLKKSLQKCIYYYRDKAHISQEEFKKVQYLAKVKELDEDVWSLFLMKKENSSPFEYKLLYNKARNLFIAIKKVVPDFTSCDNFNDYRNHIIGGDGS